MPMPNVARGFDRVMPVILKMEGGKVDDPKDPGGRTNQGITQRVYDAYRRRKGMQTRDVYVMLDAERDDIYRSQYWNAVHGDQLPEGVGLTVMDGAVNSGVSQSIKWLQRALGVEANGTIGNVTLDAINRTTDNDALIADIIAQREAFLKALKTFKRFGKGWLARTLFIERTGQAWATGSVGPVVPDNLVEAGAHQKAVLDDVKKKSPMAIGDASTGGGIGSLTLSQVVDQAKDQLSPFSAAGGWLAKVVVALIIIGALLTIGGLAWRAYAWYRNRKLKEATE
jgi:lysozyme family protein